MVPSRVVSIYVKSLYVMFKKAITQYLPVLMTGFFWSFGSTVHAAGHPNLFLNLDEIQAIKSKVNTNQQPWMTAYNTLLSNASTALSKGPYSVTFQGKSSNQYYTESPYQWPDGYKDGQINPNADRGDYSAAIALGAAVRDLGLAYAFTGDSKYAEKAINLINVWSVDKSTYMIPTTQTNNGIELFITLPGLFYGADLVWNYPGWEVDDKAAFKDWLKKLGYEAKSNGIWNNNWGNWELVLISSIAGLLEDDSLLNWAFDKYRYLVSEQIDSVGKMVHELGRTKSLSYSLYTINAMIQTAEIARHHNVNLYDYKVGSRGLELTLDYHARYAKSPGSWPYQQISAITAKDNMALFELAHSYFQKPEYLAVINHWGRPMIETRVMGNVTLTHANSFDLAVIDLPPSIISDLSDQTVDEGGDVEFALSVTGAAPLEYRWRINGQTVKTSTSPVFSLENIKTSKNGSIVDCVVSNSLGQVISGPAYLYVNSDSTPPSVTSVSALSANDLEIRFSEKVSSAASQKVENYELSPDAKILSVTLDDSDEMVNLKVDTLDEDGEYLLTVANIEDRSDSSNVLDSVTLGFVYRAQERFEDQSTNLWEPLNAKRWSVVSDEGDHSYFLNTDDFSGLSGDRLGEYSLYKGSFSDFVIELDARAGESVHANTYTDYAVVFGYQDELNYYYVMINNAVEYTQLFKVENGSRVLLDTAIADVLVDDDYHEIVVQKTGELIEVRFDGAEILSAVDATFVEGRLGVGSFNDSAYFDNILITRSSVQVTDPDIIKPDDDVTVLEWNPMTSSRWASVVDQGSDAYFLQNDNFSNLSGGRLGEYALFTERYVDFHFEVSAKSAENLKENIFADYALVFGYQDDRNYYYLMVNNVAWATQLYKVVDGNRTPLAAATKDFLYDNEYHNIEILKVGSRLTVTFDGEVMLTADDTTFSEGQVGVGSYNDRAYFKDVGITAVPPAAVADTVYQLSPLTPSRWVVSADVNGEAFLQTSDYSNAMGGRLGEYALLNGMFADFRFELSAKSVESMSANPFADYAIVFGYQDEFHYYYVLFNSAASATQLFKVSNGVRVALATAAKEVLRDNEYHKVVVERRNGEISIAFGGEYIMSATDSEPLEGRLGVGSFNDSAYFTDFLISD